MTWLLLAAALCVVAASAITVALGVQLRRYQGGPRPRLTYYGRSQQTGADVRKRLFGGE